MKIVELSGEWSITLDSTGKKACAKAPVTDFGALLAGGVIPDPFYGTNESEVQFVGED